MSVLNTGRYSRMYENELNFAPWPSAKVSVENRQKGRRLLMTEQ